MSDYRVIELTKGFVAVISKEDYRRVNRYSWYTHMSAGSKKKPGKPYARACVKGKKVYMHRFIMGEPEGLDVDHVNHMTLDNRRENLRAMCPKQNCARRRRNGKTTKKTS